jgi:hypothetical protein
MMRKIRDELDQQIQEMTWEEENDFLQKNLTSFQFLIDKKKPPNHALHPTTLHYTRLGST